MEGPDQMFPPWVEINPNPGDNHPAGCQEPMS